MTQLSYEQELEGSSAVQHLFYIGEALGFLQHWEQWMDTHKQLGSSAASSGSHTITNTSWLTAIIREPGL